MIGIYKIENSLTKRVYVGQSINIEKRFKEHIKQLNKNIHPNYHLQRAWNKYGEDNFSFSLIEECEQKALNDKETYWKLFYDKQFGTYNLGNTGNVNTTSIEKRIKVSKSLKASISKLSPEERKKKYGHPVFISEKQRQVLHEKLKGRQTSYYIRTPETNKHSQDAQKTKHGVVCFDLSWNLIQIFPSVRAACRECGVDSSAIRNW